MLVPASKTGCSRSSATISKFEPSGVCRFRCPHLLEIWQTQMFQITHKLKLTDDSDRFELSISVISVLILTPCMYKYCLTWLMICFRSSMHKRWNLLKRWSPLSENLKCGPFLPMADRSRPRAKNNLLGIMHIFVSSERRRKRASQIHNRSSPHPNSNAHQSGVPIL